jgi:hypothetical protein
LKFDFPKNTSFRQSATPLVETVGMPVRLAEKKAADFPE